MYNVDAIKSLPMEPREMGGNTSQAKIAVIKRTRKEAGSSLLLRLM